MQKTIPRSTRISGHFDEIAKIHQFRNEQFRAVREQTQNSQPARTPMADMRRTTGRKAPAGHH